MGIRAFFGSAPGTYRHFWLVPAAALHLLLAALVCLPGPAELRAADDPPEDGLFLTVPNPITSAATNRIKETIDRVSKDKNRNLRKIILDFNPDNKEAASGDFGPCGDLADYLHEKHNLWTVAFVHNKTTRHTVLPVLACKELVMSSESAIGEVVGPIDGLLNPRQLEHYKWIARPDQWALVQKMIDRQVEVVEGRKNKVVWYVDKRKAADAARDGVAVDADRVLIPSGSLALYSAADARKYGLCRAIKDTRQQVAELYQLPASSLREDPLQGRAAEVWKIDVRGTVTPGFEATLRRRIERVVRRGANMIVMQLECGGGSTETARDIADFLRTLTDQTPEKQPVVTIAFIPKEAPDSAAFIAVGCTEIVMAKDAVFGSFEHLFQTPPPMKRGQKPAPVINTDAVRDSFVDLANRQGYSPLIARGLFDRELEIYRAESAKGALERAFVTKEQLEETDAAGAKKWNEKGQIKAAGQFLQLNASRAKDCGFARYVVEGQDAKEVYALYGIDDPSKVREAGPDWLDAVVNFLGDPVVSVFLVMIGIGCLILELKMPGVSLPGVIAAICFVLFFWAQSQLNGQITLLAVLLFLLGLVLIGLEVFVVPGFGVLGFSGVILVMAGLGLATVERMPQTSHEWMQFGTAVGKFGLSMLGAMVGAFFAARYLPHIPYANRLVLVPPAEKADAWETDSNPVDSPAHLLGAIGTAATMLRPAGMAKFGDAFADVVTEGGFVPAGARVQVIEVEGNRVVVKEV